MRAFSIGVVGAGQIVRDVHLPVLYALPDARVAWIADAQAARAQALGRDYGVPSVAVPPNPGDLPPCEVVLLGIPTHARGPYYEALAARGTAVLAEKPFAIGARDHERFAALFPAHRVGCGYMRRFYRSTEILRRAVATRPFGALVAVRAAEGGRATKTGFDSSFLDRPSREGGGVLWGIGCHLLDLLAYLTSATEFEILGQDVVFDADTDREASAEIRFGSSVVARFCTSWLGPQSNRVELEFENATVSTAIQPGGTVAVELRDGGRMALDLETNEPWALTPYQAFHLEWREFLGGLTAERPSLVAASSSWLGPQTNRVELEFENATVSTAIQPGGGVRVELRDGGRMALDLETNEPGALTLYQAFHLEWRAFLGGLTAERPSLVAASSSLLTTQLIDRLLGAGSGS